MSAKRHSSNSSAYGEISEQGPAYQEVCTKNGNLGQLPKINEVICSRKDKRSYTS